MMMIMIVVVVMMRMMTSMIMIMTRNLLMSIMRTLLIYSFHKLRRIKKKGEAEALS